MNSRSWEQQEGSDITLPLCGSVSPRKVSSVYRFSFFSVYNPYALGKSLGQTSWAWFVRRELTWLRLFLNILVTLNEIFHLLLGKEIRLHKTEERVELSKAVLDGSSGQQETEDDWKLKYINKESEKSITLESKTELPITAFTKRGMI